MKVLVTGASRGLGAALVERYLFNGAQVWGVGRSSAPARVPDGKRFIYTQCDVRDADSIRMTVRDMTETGFIPDIAVFNAGAPTKDAADSFRFQSFRENFETNLFGAVIWVEEFLPHFMKRGSGVFAAVSSQSVFRENHKDVVGYSASKLALTKAFENLRLQYLPTGVRFVTFHPGRMSKVRNSVIGTTYSNAARIICVNTLAASPRPVVNFPALQYYMTRVLRFVPDAVFHRFIFR
ncbi:MAG: SDR family oxidoreductase [Deltaproteobacteria bacterium]|nr:SDR family oxidoreductase [Deltaproteobacteria bacterium]